MGQLRREEGEETGRVRGGLLRLTADEIFMPPSHLTHFPPDSNK